MHKFMRSNQDFHESSLNPSSSTRSEGSSKKTLLFGCPEAPTSMPAGKRKKKAKKKVDHPVVESESSVMTPRLQGNALESESSSVTTIRLQDNSLESESSSVKTTRLKGSLFPGHIIESSPVQYLLTEITSGSTLRNNESAGTEKRRERVYNTMFHVPWRCELLIDVGFIVCLDAFLSLFTVMPARIAMFAWQRLARLRKVRQLQRPFAAELCDFGCLVVLLVGVAILMQADISIIYHWIRGQGVIKLYVVFNVLEIFDKLCQSFGADVLQVLFNSAVSVECCKIEDFSKDMGRFAVDQCIAIVTFFLHSLVIISQAITISAAVNAQNNALLTLLISNNFAEIKSNVFKRMGTDQLHKMAYADTVERFHIMTHVLFVWAQNLLNGEDSLWLKLFYNAGMVYVCEVMVDVIKHSFLAKFNEVKPAAYSEFLQVLCTQTLRSQSHEVHKTLSFVPLAPACVVIRILLPVYASYLPDEGPMWWRWLYMLLLGGSTYIVIVIVKVIVGLGLQYHARWYLKRHPWTAPHPHFE